MSKKKKVVVGIAAAFFLAAAGFGIYTARSKTISADVPSWPTTCDEHCPKVTVRCLNEEEMDWRCGPGAGACVDYDPNTGLPTCAMFLSQKMCDILKISDNAALSGRDFRKKIECKKSDAPKSTNFIYTCCTIQHEYGHICDPEVPREPFRIMCTETFANRRASACLIDASDYYCGGGYPKWPDDVCKKNCEYSGVLAYAKNWDKCMCQKTRDGEVSEDDCCKCTNNCQDQKKAQQWAPKYCTNKNWSLIGEKWGPGPAKLCEYLASASSHKCAYFSTGPDFTFSPAICLSPTSTPTSTVPSATIPSGSVTASPTPTRTATPRYSLTAVPSATGVAATTSRSDWPTFQEIQKIIEKLKAQ